jgi:hypothetical protein
VPNNSKNNERRVQGINASSKKPLKGKNDIEIKIGCFPGINMKWLSPPPPKDEVSIAGGVRPLFGLYLGVSPCSRVLGIIGGVIR